MGRAPCCEKVGLKKGRWTEEEDEILSKYIQAHGEGSWRSLPKNAGLLRCGKSCRLRWINYLRSELKRGNITPEEEETIIKMHSTLGNRWSLIASHLPGRTDNEVKNYWNSHLSRKIVSFRKPNSEKSAPLEMDLPKINAAPKRKGGRTSRAAMQRNKTRFPTKVPKVLLEIETPQESHRSSNGNGNGPVLMPSTPTFENEALASAVSWPEESFSDIMLDACGIDYPGCDNSISDNNNNNNNNNVVVLSSPYPEPEGGLMFGCGAEREDLALFPYEERENVVPDEMKAACEDGGIFWLDDIMHGEEMVGEVSLGGATISEERDCGAMKVAVSEDLESTVGKGWSGENGEQQNSSSTNSYVGEGNWEWGFDCDFESMVQNDGVVWGDEEDKMVGWLWNYDDFGKMGGHDQVITSGSDHDKKEALVAWLLS